MYRYQILFICVVTFCVQQIENVFVTKNNIVNSLLMQYSRNPQRWQNKFPDFTSILLNEQLVQALNNQQQQLTNVQELYNEVVSKMYDQIPPQDLVEQLWNMYKKYDVQSFVTMTRAQLALYQRYSLDKIQDSNYVLLAANCLHKIKNDVFFSRLNEATQQLIEASLKTIPSSLQYLFGKQEFCLRNIQNSELILQNIDHKLNNDTSLVLSSAWHATKYMDVLQPIFEETDDDNLADLNLALVSKHLQGYFHRLPEYDNVIAANDTKRHLDNFLWRVELVNDNHLVFEQDEYLMCRHNGSHVYGLKKKTIYDKECQWSAGECKDKI